MRLIWGCQATRTYCAYCNKTRVIQIDAREILAARVSGTILPGESKGFHHGYGGRLESVETNVQIVSQRVGFDLS